MHGRPYMRHMHGRTYAYAYAKHIYNVLCYTQIQPCCVDTSCREEFRKTTVSCTIPPLEIPTDFLRGRPESDDPRLNHNISDSLLDFRIGVIFDGLDTYRNLSNQVPELDVYDNPIFDQTDDVIPLQPGEILNIMVRGSEWHQ